MEPLSIIDVEDVGSYLKQIMSTFPQERILSAYINNFRQSFYRQSHIQIILQNAQRARTRTRIMVDIEDPLLNNLIFELRKNSK